MVGIFENALKKVIDCQKRNFGHFWRLLTFLAFSKILTKITFLDLLFLKLTQKKNMKKNCFSGFYFKLENALLQGSTNFCS